MKGVAKGAANTPQIGHFVRYCGVFAAAKFAVFLRHVLRRVYPRKILKSVFSAPSGGWADIALNTVSTMGRKAKVIKACISIFVQLKQATRDRTAPSPNRSIPLKSMFRECCLFFAGKRSSVLN